MNRRLSLVFVLAVIALVAGSSLAQAQQILVGQIPFRFLAGGVSHDPGRYELTVSDDQTLLTLAPEKGKGHATELLSLTRLAIPAGGLPQSRLIFDKVGNTFYLSEAWFSGMDGYVLHIEKGPHSHETIQLGNKDR